MSFEFTDFDHIQLAAPPQDEAKAREFFAGILNLKEIPKPDNLAKRGGVWFKVGDKELHIGIEDPFSPAKKAHPAFAVDDIEDLKIQLRKNNIPVHEDTPLQGAERFYTHDPFGNKIEFIERK
ncbi:VOC family protein [Corticicoccus populi]|uniref:VOC family protein n=1 Tax=Corticicoccus populi TaxID=1812821 RepID=A0ABW5WS40_9STAP